MGPCETKVSPEPLLLALYCSARAGLGDLHLGKCMYICVCCNLLITTTLGNENSVYAYRDCTSLLLN